MKFSAIKANYDRRLWSKGMLAKLVEKNFLTENQFIEITGEAPILHHAIVANSTSAEELFLLNNPGTVYHRWDCEVAKSGRKVTMDELVEKYPDANPCEKCNPVPRPVPVE